MALPQPIDREAVKVLAIAVGVREAARRMGLKENTVMSWSMRDNWFPKPQVPPTITKQNGNAISASKTPSQALEAVLKQRHGKTKLHLSKAVEKASKYLGKAEAGEILTRSRQMNDVAGTMTKIWPEDQNRQAGDFQLNLMGGRAVIQVNQQSDKGLRSDSPSE